MNSTGSHSGSSGWRIVIAGTGGQGVLTAARLLCETMVEEGHHVVSGQLHGMAQRGGAVQSSVLIDAGISPVIGLSGATCVLGFEPVETARALPLIAPETVVYMNTAPVIPYVLGQRQVLEQGDATYPDLKLLTDSVLAVTRHLHTLDATKVAVEVGSVTALNMVMLGCLLASGMLPCPADRFWQIASGKMPQRMADQNTRAFYEGVKLGAEFHVGATMS
jgi:indolepyruvate ferredoxin oxidoreductase beta subunit